MNTNRKYISQFVSEDGIYHTLAIVEALLEPKTDQISQDAR